MDIRLMAGPLPGAGLFRTVLHRLQAAPQAEARRKAPAAEIVEWLHPDAAAWPDAAARLADDLRRGPPCALVAHGLAVPVAVAAARIAPPARLVLSHGPISRLDPVTAALSRAAAGPAAALLAALLHPALSVPAMASSAGFRRLVVNPYVMDRDIIATIARPSLQQPAWRAALVRFLASLQTLPDPADLACPITLIWGDADPLYPSSEADDLDARYGGGHHVRVPGAQHFLIEEHPWAFADALLALPGLQPMSGSR